MMSSREVEALFADAVISRAAENDRTAAARLARLVVTLSRRISPDRESCRRLVQHGSPEVRRAAAALFFEINENLRTEFAYSELTRWRSDLDHSVAVSCELHRRVTG